MYLSTYLCICVYLCIYARVCMYLCTVYLAICLSVCLSTYASTYVSLRIYWCIMMYLFPQELEVSRENDQLWCPFVPHPIFEQCCRPEGTPAQFPPHALRGSPTSRYLGAKWWGNFRPCRWSWSFQACTWTYRLGRTWDEKQHPQLVTVTSDSIY